MSAEAAVASGSWSVGRYTATLTVQRPQPGAAAVAVIEWSPEQPQRLDAAELAEYRRGRNRVIAEVAAGLGISAAVLEL